VLNCDCNGKLNGLGLSEMRSTLHVWERERKGFWKVRRPFGTRASIQKYRRSYSRYEGSKKHA